MQVNIEPEKMMFPPIPIRMLAGLLLVGCVQPDNTGDVQDMEHQGPAMNFHRISPKLATAGHLLDAGTAELVEQGVTLVIDLRDRPPAAERQALEEAGIRWVNVPVVWAAPENTDFEEFARLMAANEGESILVQCQANYRASAMTYLYRVTRQSVSESRARRDLYAIWSPDGTWRDYIEGILAAEGREPGEP